MGVLRATVTFLSVVHGVQQKANDDSSNLEGFSVE